MSTRRDFLKQVALLSSFAGLSGTIPHSYQQHATGTFRPSQDRLLWYKEPAVAWTEALPIGNAYMGAMIFGNPKKEHLQLNESTLYSGDPTHTYKQIDIRKKYGKVTSLIKAGKYKRAQQIVQDDWLGRNQQCYQPLGDLWIDVSHNRSIKNYQRKLNISDAIASVSYTVGSTTYRRSYFASYPDHVIIVKLSTEGPGKIYCRTHFSTPHSPTVKYFADDEILVIQGKAPGFVLRRSLDQVEKLGDQHKYPELFDKNGNRLPHAKRVLYDEEVNGLGMKFDARLATRLKGGNMQVGDKYITVNGADEVTFILSAATSYNGYDKSPAYQGVNPAEKTTQYLSDINNRGYETLKDRHTSDYKNLFSRVGIRLGQRSDQSKRPTDERIKRFSNGDDTSLAGLYFQYGRYLMIAGSRPGGQPLNLQGIWNKERIPPWNGAYTMNINLEMNYWPAELTNLSECHEPLLKAIKQLAENGKKTAWNMFGNQGWTANHNMTIWRHAEPVDNCFCSFWPMSAGWLMNHYWERYLVHGDRTFLRKKVFPLLKGAALFYSDWLMKNEQGYLVTPVGMSPENRFIDANGDAVGFSQGPTMDIAIIRGVYERYLKACQILNINDEFTEKINNQLTQLLPYQIGKYGQLQEWSKDFEEVDRHHRHISNLYGFYPGNQITIEETARLAAAVKQTMLRRGDKATGWSMAWKTNVWARLRDGNHAFKILNNLFHLVKESGNGLFPNLFSATGPFQIDANFGATAGIAVMLVQSHDGVVQLLPALPDAWPEGSVKGLKTRGGFEIDLKWKNAKITKVIIRSTLGGNCRIRTYQKLKLSKNDNVDLSLASGENPNPFFYTPNIKKPLLSSEAENRSAELNLRPTNAYDLPTQTGREYIIEF